jgi:MSHA biogenesis protein MshK
MSAPRSVNALLLLAVAIAAPAHAQALSDPTRPPSYSEAGRDAEPRASMGPVLQSVIVSGGRKLALIDGRTYTVGDKVGEAKLVAISGSEVTLREPGGNKILRLTPDVQKTTAAPKGPPRTSPTPTRTKGQE